MINGALYMIALSTVTLVWYHFYAHRDLGAELEQEASFLSFFLFSFIRGSVDLLEFKVCEICGAQSRVSKGNKIKTVWVSPAYTAL